MISLASGRIVQNTDGSGLSLVGTAGCAGILSGGLPGLSGTGYRYRVGGRV